MKTIDDRLPKIGMAFDGTRIATKEQWEGKRRPEILGFFKDEVYGNFPDRPEDLSFRVVSSERSVFSDDVTTEVLEASFSGDRGTFSFPFYMFIPRSDRPVPVMLLICNRSKAENIDLSRQIHTDFFPVEYLTSHGYAAVSYWVEDLDTDRDDGSVNGVQQVFSLSGDHAWGTIAAWAWGAMRVMDHIETDARLDRSRVAVIGQSRGGKTALYAAACDERFNAVYSSCSGCTGAALSLYKDGETIRQINEVFPYWFCKAYRKYDGNEAALRCDQHELLSLIAPRCLYVASASMDDWADPKAEYASAYLAGEAYGYYGLKGLESDVQPRPCLQVTGDRVGYHLRPGVHDLTLYDWQMFMSFLESRK